MCTQSPLLTVLVMDEYRKALPVGWSIQSNETEETFVQFLQEVKKKVEAIRPGWRPSCFLVDDCVALANALR